MVTMGNREDLLTGAVRCLKEKGWARTTVRDIATAAGVSHAAIGYHFGSREALLIAAFVQAMDEWGAQTDRAFQAADPQATWDARIASFHEQRELWLASVEAMIQAEHNAELRELLAAANREGRRGLAAAQLGIDEDDVDEVAERSVGAVESALLSGIMVQVLLDPEHAPSGKDIVAGLRALAARLGA
jgi:AcrR family transcriptional regulator